jgi:hypothetical protein
MVAAYVLIGYAAMKMRRRLAIWNRGQKKTLSEVQRGLNRSDDYLNNAPCLGKEDRPKAIRLLTGRTNSTRLSAKKQHLVVSAQPLLSKCNKLENPA